MAELPITNLNMQANVDTRFGNVPVPSGYTAICVDFIADGLVGSGWGSLILHSTPGGTVYGMSLGTLTDVKGTIKVLCKRV